MLQSIRLKNFKCFEDQEFPCRDLTILTGLNGMGKSSLLQSLLLLRQSKDSLTNALSLNGEYVTLGVAKDVLYEEAADDSFSISYVEDGLTNEFCFGLTNGDEDNVPTHASRVENGSSVLFSGRFTYLSAYRIAPQPLYRITSDSRLGQRDFGANGEYAIQYLKMNSDRKISCSNAILGDPENGSLGIQVQAWLNMVSPGVYPIISVNPSSRTAELNFEFVQGSNKTMTYKSMNVGFGITYVLPVIVTLLSAKRGDMILIENPEAHIHPKGQRYLGELIARVAAGGVQVFLETHSDHVLNGIRIAARNNLIDAECVVIGFFTQAAPMFKDYKRHIIWPKLLQNGQLDQWPDGFFDEWDNSLLELL